MKLRELLGVTRYAEFRIYELEPTHKQARRMHHFEFSAVQGQFIYNDLDSESDALEADVEALLDREVYELRGLPTYIGIDVVNPLL